MLQRNARRAALALLLAATALASPVIASSDARAGSPTKRALPDYDGRPAPDPTVGDVLLWVPRVALSPAYVVTEYVVRRPLGFLITEAERADLASLLITVFTFGDSDAGVVPTFLLDFGIEAGALPSGGLYFFWDDVTFDGHDLRLRAATAGSDWYQLALTNRLAFDDASRLTVDFDYDRRKDHVFAGIGPAFDEDAIGRYGMDRVSGSVGYTRDLGQRGEIALAAQAAHFSFFRARCCEDPPIQDRVAAGTYALPTGYGDAQGYVGPDLRLAVDSRAVRPGSESGVRIELGGLLAKGVGGDDATWLRTTVSLGGYLDVLNNRTLGLRLYGDLVTPLEGEVPFSELATLGDDAPLRGFAEGRLRGQSAVAAVVDYRWPIWVFLDGHLFIELGNVFGEGFDGFDVDQLRFSAGFGVRPASREDHEFELMVALGTEPLGDGGAVTTARLVFGTTSGF